MGTAINVCPWKFSAAVLFGVLAERAKRTLFFSKLDFKLLIDRQQSFLVVAFQAVNLLVAQLHYHAENMGGLRAEFIPFGALHNHRISGLSVASPIPGWDLNRGAPHLAQPYRVAYPNATRV